ncbi:MAG: glycosyltransferase [Caldilineales bacterium]|nr:glycosyltransferase [Caldilineales bacterium]MDW8318809.1 glycosyltransferase [Anaerolineae bacterium]
MALRLLILMSDTGGGHRASAQALAAALRRRYGDQIETTILDAWQGHAPWPLNQVPKSYSFLVNRTPWFYSALYHAGERRRVMGAVIGVAAMWSDRRFMAVVEAHRPDAVLSVHPLLQEAPLRILARHGLSLPFFTVVTDLGSVHPSWFHPAVRCCFVPTAETAAQAQRLGLQPTQVRVLGLPIRPEFGQPQPDQTTLRRALGLQPDLATVTVIGGGEGMGPLRAIAEAIAHRLAADGRRAQLVVICGRNQRLQSELSRVAWPVPTAVTGFVDNMAQWMAASDCLVTKAGPGTIAEAMAMGLPLVLSGYIPGQETGNVHFVVDHGIGVFAPKPAQVAEVVSRWLGPDQGERLQRAQAARALAYPHAADAIAAAIAAELGLCRPR